MFLYTLSRLSLSLLFFFNDTATTEIYTLSLHDALPISSSLGATHLDQDGPDRSRGSVRDLPISQSGDGWCVDRKSTRLNSSHTVISYAVFCLKKKKLDTFLFVT